MALAGLVGPPLVLGKYQSVQPLGQGGMGMLFLGRCRVTGMKVVIKQIHRELADHPLARASFERELDVMKRFRHPHAVALIDGGWDGDAPCLVLEHVAGITLEDFAARNGRVGPRRIGRWLGQLCQALHAAHGSGILHRDLSLANLMLLDQDSERERIKVLDFGLARRHGGVYVPMEKIGGSDAAIGGGTPDYLCPEQIRGDSVDARSDIYSVGVILYRLLTGHLPFEEAESVGDILRAQQQTLPPRFSHFDAGDTPLPLEAVVRLCMEKDPSERPQSARELAELYAEALGEAIVPPESFLEVDLPAVAEAPRYDASHVLDRIEAWLPEPVAVVKLRGFVAGVGGEVVGSEPGMLRVRLRDPRGSTSPKRSFAWFGTSRRDLADTDEFLHLALFMERKSQEGRNAVEIAVVLEGKTRETPADAEMRSGFGQRMCKELRSYLMTV